MTVLISYKKIMMMALDMQDPNAKIRIYSIQHEDILKDFDAPGNYICGSKEHRFDYDIGTGDPYNWMQNQLSKKIQPYSGDLPIWAWPKKPDMRQYKGFAKGYVRIIAEVPWSRVVMSDFDLWHCVLNNQYLALTEEEFNANENATQEQKELSWERVFKFHFPESKEEADWLGIHASKGKLPYLSPQLCIDRIYKDEIISIKHIK